MSALVQFPFPSLRMVSREVPEDEFDQGLRDLAQLLADEMVAAGGVGLAANQLGFARRVIAVREIEKKNSNRVMVMVNPVILSRSEEMMSGLEGCLSLPGVSVTVERHERVEVRGVNERGQEIHLEASEGEARIFQHEIDHLDGKLMIDYVSPRVRREAVSALWNGKRLVQMRELNEEHPLGADSIISVPKLKVPEGIFRTTGV